MPIKILQRPTPATPAAEPPSGLRRMLAGAARVGSGYLASIPSMEPGLGSLVGGGIAGAGETGAELLEGDTPDIRRIGVEAALGAVPMGSILKMGKPVASAARSALLSGSGEGLRQVARGENLDPSSILSATALGGITGGILGHYTHTTPPIPEAAPAGPFSPAKPTANLVNPRTGEIVAQKNVPIAPRLPTVESPRDLTDLLGVETEKRVAGALKKSTVGPKNVQDIDKGIAGAGRMGQKIRQEVLDEIPDVEKAHDQANKILEAEQAATRFSLAKKGLQAQEPTVSESLSAKTGPGTRGRVTTKYEAEEPPTPGGGRRKAAPDVVEYDEWPPTGEPAPPEPQGAEAIYQRFLKTRGLTDTPSIRSQFPWEAAGGKAPTPPEAPQSLSETLGVKPAGEVALNPETPPVAPPEALPEVPSRFTQPAGEPGPFSMEKYMEDRELYTGLDEDTLPGEGANPGLYKEPTLPAEVPTEPYSEGRGFGEPEPTPESPLTKLFGSRLEAAGENYRDIKKAIGAGETKLTEPTGLLDSRGRPRTASNLAGSALSREAKAAGLAPTRPTPPSVEPVVPGAGGVATEEPPVGPQPSKGVSQTQKARDAALAKRQAAREAKQQELPGADATTESQVNEAQQIADEVKAQGGSAEDIRAAIIKRLGGESGAASPALLAKLGLTATGALLGGIAGGAVGHPFLGMAAGAGAGLLGPDAIAAGLKQIGAHPEVAEAAKEAAQTPEGVKGIAQKIFATLPQVQRFNLLMDAWGLPANAFFGPYGSAMMAGLEAHLSGDPRGMQVLKTLTPQRFMKEYTSSLEEAGRLIREGEMGRAETAVLGTGKGSNIIQMPGQMMTAGDVASRKILEEAGFSADEARRITLTSEPETQAGKKVANFSKGSPLLQLMQPFARTPANIAEQGAMRIPGLGSAVQYLGREAPDTLRRQLVQQGLGLATGGAGYLAGENLDPETAKTVRRYLTNFGGQYSLPVGVGFAAGQAARGDSGSGTMSALSNLFNALPLPSSSPLSSWAKSATTGAPPRGMVPDIALDLIWGDQTKPSNPLARPRSFIRRKP